MNSVSVLTFHDGVELFLELIAKYRSLLLPQEGLMIVSLGIDYRTYTKFRHLSPVVENIGDEYDYEYDYLPEETL
jgi:hypothetical protein